VAHQFLQEGGYNPRPCNDVYAMGQCMLDTTGGHRPPKHSRLTSSRQFIAESGNASRNMADLPQRLAHLHYQANLLDETKPASDRAYHHQVWP